MGKKFLEFLEYRNLLTKVSSFFAKRYRLNYQDIYSEACWIFIQTLEKYNEKRNVKFSTFLYSRLRYLHTYCKKEKKILCSNLSLEAADSIVFDIETQCVSKLDFELIKKRLGFTKFFDYLSQIENFSSKKRRELLSILREESGKSLKLFKQNKEALQRFINYELA
jgi:DNA-directed RNA polymerase specialized sigma subunit